MGCDIHIIAQRREAEEWKTLDSAPFGWRSYGMFGFLADVRNYSAVPPIAAQRGLPEDFDPEAHDVGDHSYSWLTVEELLAFDYDQPLEDRRVTRQTSTGIWNGGHTAEPGGGEMTTFRAFLGQCFFDDLEQLKAIGAGRIVFGFDC